MLDSIRSGAQSLWVKIAFGVIILVFVFWGIGNYNDRDYSNVVAVVNGEPIVALEFEKAYHNAEEYLLRNNPGLTREQLARDHLGRQVLNDLIRQTLIAQEARRAGIAVSPLEMRRAVAEIKMFQDESGKFDPEAYKRVLANQRISPGEYEKGLENGLLQEKIFNLVTDAAWVSPDEPLKRFNYLRERRIIDYIFTPASDFAKDVKLSDADMEKWYETHKADYVIPARVNVAYITVDPVLLADPGKITDESARAFYETNKSKYERPESAHARHILVAVRPDADEAELKAARERISKASEQIDKGRPFAEVADEINEAGAAEKGGDLGWIEHGQTIPEFEEALFALPAGKVSAPVRTPYGWHLILVEEKRDAGIAPFEEVAPEIRKTLAVEEGSERLHEALDNLIEDNILNKPLAQAAARYGLKTGETGLEDQKGLIEALGIKPEAAASLLAVPAGAPVDTALEAGDNYIVARIIDAAPEGIKSFSEARANVAERMTAERSLELAMSAAATLLERIKGESLAQIRDQKIDLVESEPLERGGVLPGFAPDEKMMADIFATKPHSWLSMPLPVKKGETSGALLAYIDRLVPPAESEYDSVAELLTKAARQERQEGLYALFAQRLARNAKIEITNQNLVDRVNM